jgi:hypothetical protein
VIWTDLGVENETNLKKLLFNLGTGFRTNSTYGGRKTLHYEIHT